MKVPPWWRGTTAAFHEKRGSPERGNRLPLLSGLGGGRAFAGLGIILPMKHMLCAKMAIQGWLELHLFNFL